MRIGLVGIGDIAKKGYLPVLCNRADVELMICTRNPEVLKATMDQYHLSYGTTELEEFLKQRPDGVFVTAATGAHYALAKQVLEAGIPCHLDKPMSLNYEESKELTDYAQAHGILFTIGFNRRYVPYVKKVHDMGIPDLVLYQKNRHLYPDVVRRFIVEDFVHVIDTTRYLLQDEVIDIHVTSKKEGDKLVHVVVQLKTASNLGICIMNYANGVTEEIIEVAHSHKKSIVRNLASFEVYDQGAYMTEMPNDWLPTLKKRGFMDMTQAFIDSLRNQSKSPIDPLDALRSHEICELIVKEIEKN